MGSFFKSITGFFDKYLMIGMVVTLVAVTSAWGIAQYRLSEANQDLAASLERVAKLEDKVLQKDTLLSLMEGVQVTLQRRNSALLTEQQTYNDELQEIRNAKDEISTPVDNAVCRAISGADCVRSNDKP